MKHIISSALLTISLLFVSTGVDALDLKLNLVEGMTWQEKFEVDMEITTDAATMSSTKEDLEALLQQLPEPQTEQERAQIDAVKRYLEDSSTQKPFMTLVMSGLREYEVKEATPGESYKIAATMRSVKVAVGGFMMPATEIDSSKDTNPSSGLDAILLMLDEDLVLTLDGGGKVTSVQGIERIVDKAAEQYGNDPTMRQQITSMIKQQQQEYAMQDLAPYPNHDVGVGDSWVLDLPIQMQQGSEASTMPVKMTLIKREGGKAHIKGTGDMIMETPMSNGSQSPSSKVPISVTIDLVVDETTGLPLEMLTDMESHMEVQQEGSGMQQFDSHLTIKLTNTKS